jgi:hypothetical protein
MRFNLSALAVGEALGGLLVATGFERMGAIILISFLAVVSARWRHAVRELVAATDGLVCWGNAHSLLQEE